MTARSPQPPTCGASTRGFAGTVSCELKLGHNGDHRNKSCSTMGIRWKDTAWRCASRSPRGATRCGSAAGHAGQHQGVSDLGIVVDWRD